VCAPVHDAVLICAPLDWLDVDVARMQDIMREASRIVLNEFELGTDATVVTYPDRYMDERGTVMWQRVMALVDGAEAGHESVAAPTDRCCFADNTTSVSTINVAP
jgi:DNA polymerase I